jgi:hypothetical protein
MEQVDKSDEICRKNDQGTESKAWRENGVRRGVVKESIYTFACLWSRRRERREVECSDYSLRRARARGRR